MKTYIIFSMLAALMIALMVVSIILLGIILSKENNRKPNPAPAVNIVSYYFNIHSYSVSYADVQHDYAAAAAKLSDELSKVLSPSSTQRRYRKRAATVPSLSILGISGNQPGGVIVMSGISYLDNVDPGVTSVRKRLGSLANTTLLNIIDNQNPTPATSDSQLCTVVNDRPSIGPTKSTTATNGTTNTAIISTTPNTPSVTTTSARTTTLSGTTNTTIISSTPSPSHIKCKIDIGIVFDASTSSGKPNLIKQIEFTTKMSTTWTIDKNSVEILAFLNGYDDDIKGHYVFNYTNNSEFVTDLEHLSHYPLQGTHCVECALSDVLIYASDSRPSVSLATLLFVYGSDYNDVRDAIKYDRDELIQGNNKIVIVAVGSNVDIRLLKSITGSLIAAQQLDESLINQINEEICSPRVDALPLPPPPSPATTTSGTTLPTAAPFPDPLPKGAVDVSIIMDASDAAGSDNLIKQSAFIADRLISKWIINMSATEVDVHASALNNYYDGRYIFNYPSKLDLENDLKRLGRVGSLGASCIDCGILLVSQNYLDKRYDAPLISIIFTYASIEADISFAKEDASSVLADATDKLIIVGVGSGADEKRLQSVTDNVIIANELDDALASKINSAIWNTKGAPTTSSLIRELSIGKRESKSFARRNGMHSNHNHLKRALRRSLNRPF